MSKREENKHYRVITFGENRARLRLLIQFRDLVNEYFNNSTLNMLEKKYAEKEEAVRAKTEINLIIKQAYNMIRLAHIKTSATSTSTVAIGIRDQNIDLILNMFNLGRHDIAPGTAIELIEDAIDVYKSNRLGSFMRTINPLFWLKVFIDHIASGNKERAPE